MTYIIDDMRKQLDLFTETGCGDTKEEKEVNEGDLIRMKELAGMAEDHPRREEWDNDEDEPSTFLTTQLRADPRDTIEIFDSRAGGMVAEQLANILGFHYRFSQWGGTKDDGMGGDSNSVGGREALEEQNSNALKIIVKFLRDRGEDDVANEIDEYLTGHKKMWKGRKGLGFDYTEEDIEEDGYDYREMEEPDPNDYDRLGMDWDAFAKKGHGKKSKKRVNNYGDNPMAEEKVNEETDEDGNWIKPWGKDEVEVDDKDDDKEEVDENELFEKLLDEYETFKLNESSSQWVIMNATKKVFGKLRMSLEDIVRSEWFDNGCVMVVNFDHGGHAFVFGSGDRPYGVVGETRDYVQDTGKGYGRRGQLEIENFICVKDSEIVTSANHTGQNEKRPLWVFK